MGSSRRFGVGNRSRSVQDVGVDSIADKPDNKLQIFFVADGSFVTQRPVADWFNPHIRIIALAYNGSEPFDSDTSKWTLCIVGSRLLNNSDRNTSFLQVASWNGLTFRFYQVSPGTVRSESAETCQNDLVNTSQSNLNDAQPQAWNYFGSSMDAFGPNSYLGPFNGHVNGACIMKELHKQVMALSMSYQSNQCQTMASLVYQQQLFDLLLYR